MGVGWYWAEFDAPSHWAGRCVRIEFEAVFHTAKVWLNGATAWRASGRGYTAFILDATPALRLDTRNFLAVKVDNSFTPTSFPATGLTTGRRTGESLARKFARYSQPYIDRLWIDAIPNLDAGRTPLQIRATVRNTSDSAQQLTLSYQVLEEGSGVALARVERAGEVRLEPRRAKR